MSSEDHVHAQLPSIAFGISSGVTIVDRIFYSFPAMLGCASTKFFTFAASVTFSFNFSSYFF